jgi:hypothetical protein
MEDTMPVERDRSLVAEAFLRDHLWRFFCEHGFDEAKVMARRHLNPVYQNLKKYLSGFIKYSQVPA